MAEKATHRHDITENEKQVLNLIRKHRQISRTELSQRYDMPPSSLSRTTEGLFQKNLIIESGTSGGNGKGRRQIRLELDYARFKAIGIGITRKSIRTVLMDLSGKIYAEAEMPFTKDAAPQATIQALAQELRGMCREHAVRVQDLLGIGIGSPGPLERNSGTIIDFLWVKDWKTVRIAEQLKSYLDTQIVLDFGANAALMGEKWYGIGQEYQNIVYVNVGWQGIGCSIMNNETLIRHNNYDAISLGHMIIDLHGEKCECGNNGCLELYTCEEAVVKTFKEMTASGGNSVLINDGQIMDNVSFDDIASSADRGDILSVQSISKAASILGTGLVNFINIISPDLVILGGSLLERSELYYNICVSVAKSKLFGSRKDEVVFTRNELKKHVIPLGAGAIVFDEYFNQ
jgi:predicted NBD/HSP70 family sugar kinase